MSTFSKIVLNHIRNFVHYSPEEAKLINRKFLKTLDLNSSDIKSLIWTALDLKQVSKKTEVNNINSSNITLLMHEPSLEIQAPATTAGNLLNSHINIIIDPKWDVQEYMSDQGNFLSTCSDLILCQSKYQSKIEKLAKGSSIPVVCVRSCTYSIVDVLADVMTLQERYGHLKNLKLGWIGKPCPLINTFLCIAPRLGMDIQYCCCCGPDLAMSPLTLPEGQSESSKEHTNLKECGDAESAIQKVHTIIVSKHAVEKHKIDLKHIRKNANEDWSLLHELPRGNIEVEPEVFNHEHSLVWQAKGNLQWVYAAIMLRLISNYKHVSKIPTFDNKP